MFSHPIETIQLIIRGQYSHLVMMAPILFYQTFFHPCPTPQAGMTRIYLSVPTWKLQILMSIVTGSIYSICHLMSQRLRTQPARLGRLRSNHLLSSQFISIKCLLNERTTASHLKHYHDELLNRTSMSRGDDHQKKREPKYFFSSFSETRNQEIVIHPTKFLFIFSASQLQPKTSTVVSDGDELKHKVCFRIVANVLNALGF